MSNEICPPSLRWGSCSCMPEEIVLPKYFSVDFMHQRRKTTLNFCLEHVIIPQENEIDARFDSRVLIFLDAHKGRTRHGGVTAAEIWRTSLELCTIVPQRQGAHHQIWQRRYGYEDDLVIYTERWKMWEQSNIPLTTDILSGFKILLQRHKRSIGWDAFQNWLVHMTPPEWILPDRFTVL